MSDAFLADCALAEEMLAAWPARGWEPLASALRAGPILLVGEGSSRLVPLGLARRLVRAWDLAGLVDGCGGRQVPAATRATLVALSNSGRTREVAEGLRGRAWLAVTGVAGGPLATGARAALAVLPRPEQAVAATASVLGQTLVVAQALAERAGRPLPIAALRRALAQAPPSPAPAAARWWILGADDGVAEELALKAWETAGIAAAAVPAGLALHGLEEVLAAGDAVVLVEADAADRAAIAARVAATGATLHELAAGEAGELTPLARLAAGWRLLHAAALQRGRDPARPLRARKVGNPVAAP